MADISNKTLSLLLIGAIVISLMGTLISLNRLGKIGVPVITGAGTSDTGEAQLTIASQLSITVVDSTINFGSCTPGSGNTSVVDSNNTELDGTSGGQCDNLQVPQNITVENDGNQLANITVKTSDNDITGGVNYSLYFAVANATDRPGCVGTMATSWTNFTDITPTEYLACDKLNYTDSPGKDRFWTFIRVWVPADAVQGSQSATITFTAQASQE